MHHDLENAYIPSCTDCQRNKSTTTKPVGLSHPLPIPDARCDSVAIDFIGPLPVDNRCNYLHRPSRVIDKAGLTWVLMYISLFILSFLVDDLLPISFLMAEQLAEIFFDKWYCKNGLLLRLQQTLYVMILEKTALANQCKTKNVYKVTTHKQMAAVSTQIRQ